MSGKEYSQILKKEKEFIKRLAKIADVYVLLV